MSDIFENFIHSQGITFKYARGISARSGKEFHVFHEIIYYLDGDAEFISENLHMQLQPETLIIIPKETYHQLIIHGDQQRYYRCLLQFPDCPGFTVSMPGITAVRADDEIRYLFGKLKTLSRQEDGEAQALLEAFLSIVLHALKGKNEITGKENFQIEIIRKATDYINQNIHRKILLCEIAGACNVSVSALAHIFKKEMNIPIHKFIIKKRLMNAHHAITAGTPAMAAAMEYGFLDYSGFYKQYKKMFGCSPSRQNDT